jgi:hypothetical protein
MLSIDLSDRSTKYHAETHTVYRTVRPPRTLNDLPHASPLVHLTRYSLQMVDKHDPTVNIPRSRFGILVHRLDLYTQYPKGNPPSSA